MVDVGWANDKRKLLVPFDEAFRAGPGARLRGDGERANATGSVPCHCSGYERAGDGHPEYRILRVQVPLAPPGKEVSYAPATV